VGGVGGVDKGGAAEAGGLTLLNCIQPLTRDLSNVM
jgi:hypothetical protein